jgi:hypothetical protein
MLKRNFLLFIAISLLLGCVSSPKIKLHTKWKPLIYIVESPGHSKFTYIAWDKCMYLSSIKKWKTKSKIHKHSSLLHERAHIVSQEKLGLICFGWKYYWDIDFRKEEEKLAYSLEIHYMLSKGWTINKKYYIDLLSGELYNHMMSKEEVRKWLEEVLKPEFKQKIPKHYWVPDD